MIYKPKRKKFLSATLIDTAVEEIGLRANDERISVALLGDAAMQLYGSDRLTVDVDFVADAPIALIDSEPLRFGGVAGKTESGVPVDLIVREGDTAPLYFEALHEAQRVEGIAVRVVTPEFLAVMKLEAGRVKDIEDLRFLLMSGAADATAARNIAYKFLGHYGAKDFDSYVAEAEWEVARAKREMSLNVQRES